MIHLYQDNPVGGADLLNSLGDVNINNPENKQIIYYDSATGTWRNYNPPFVDQDDILHTIEECTASTDPNDVAGASVISSINSKTLKELWKNTSPSSAFAAQTITLSSNDYDYLILISKNAASSNGALSFMALKGMGFYSQWVNRDGNYPLVAYKFIQYTDDTHYAAPDTTVSAHTSGLSTNNNYLVPIAIYGGKF